MTAGSTTYRSLWPARRRAASRTSTIRIFDPRVVFEKGGFSSCLQIFLARYNTEAKYAASYFGLESFAFPFSPATT